MHEDDKGNAPETEGSVAIEALVCFPRNCALIDLFILNNLLLGSLSLLYQFVIFNLHQDSAQVVLWSIWLRCIFCLQLEQSFGKHFTFNKVLLAHYRRCPVFADVKHFAHFCGLIKVVGDEEH